MTTHHFPFLIVAVLVIALAFVLHERAVNAAQIASGGDAGVFGGEDMSTVSLFGAPSTAGLQAGALDPTQLAALFASNTPPASAPVSTVNATTQPNLFPSEEGQQPSEYWFGVPIYSTSTQPPLSHIVCQSMGNALVPGQHNTTIPYC